MKRILICMLLVLTLLLTACGAKSEPAQQGEGSAAAETASLVGTISGNTYTNEALGYGCTLEGWVYATQDQIAELFNITLDSTDEEFSEQLQNADTYMDMYAQREDNLLNVNVNFENLSSVYAEDLTEQEYVDLSLPQAKAAMEQMQLTNVQMEQTTVVLDGTEHPGIVTTGEYNGVQVFQRQACVKCGTYMGIITVTSYGEDHSAEPFALFFRMQ